MSISRELINKLNDEIGDEPKLKEPKTLRLLKETVKLLKENNNKNSLELIRKELNNILDEIDFKDYTDEFIVVGNLLKEIKDEKTPTDVLENLVNKFIKIVSEQEFPTEIKVNNFPKQKEFPKSISIDNFPEQKDKIEVTNFPKDKEYPKEIKISNFPKEKKRIKVYIDKSISIKKPTWYKPFTIDKFFVDIGNLFIKISDRVFKIDASKHKKAKEAIAVKLVDKDGKFIDKLIPPIHVSNPGGSGGTVSKGVFDSNDNRINPATKELQESKLLTDNTTIADISTKRSPSN